MNITLIRPPAYSSTGLMGAQLVPYLGIAYIGGALRQAGHQVDIIDMCAEDITRTERIDGKFILNSENFPEVPLPSREGLGEGDLRRNQYRREQRLLRVFGARNDTQNRSFVPVSQGGGIKVKNSPNSKFIQYGMPLAKLAGRLRPSDVIGFTCMFSQEWPFNRRLIQHVHALSPKSILLAGGEHINALPEYCLADCPELDICVLGEGEDVIVQLVDTLARQGLLSDVPGLVHRTSVPGVLSRTAKAARIRQVDSLAWPAWDLIPLENYLSRGLNYHISRGRTLPILATRGCPYQCTFCSNTNMWGAPWVARTAAVVADEMEHYINAYHVENFVFSDLTAVIQKEKIIALCQEIIHRKINVTWQLPTLRTEAVDREVLDLMYQAGCRDLDFAIESGSEQVLKSVHKGNDPRRIFRLIEDGLAAGMNLSTNIVIGLPEEGWRDFFRTYWLMMRLAVRGLQELNVFPFIPYPGSKLFYDFQEKGRLVLSDDFFLNLFGYADLTKAVSWSEHFGPRTLSFLRFFLLSSFYAVMLVTHPRRLWRLIRNSVTGQTTTKLEGVLRRIFRNIRAGNQKGN